MHFYLYTNAVACNICTCIDWSWQLIFLPQCCKPGLETATDAPFNQCLLGNNL